MTKIEFDNCKHETQESGWYEGKYKTLHGWYLIVCLKCNRIIDGVKNDPTNS